jgi:hypothetical protein
MTYPLRRAHRFVWIALAIILPILFIAALAVRRPSNPPNQNLHWEEYR